MRTQITPEQAKGRTVEGYHADYSEAVILLSGNAFLYLKAGMWPESDKAHLEPKHRSQFNFEENLADAVKWGLCNEAEAEALKVLRNERNAADNEKRERSLLKSLLEKYGTP